MSIDERGRQAGATLRAHIGQIDAVAGLDALTAGVRRRRHMRTAATVAAAAVFVIGGLTVTDRVHRVHVPPTSDGRVDIGPIKLCDLAFISCEAGSQFTVHLQQPMTWTLPEGFSPHLRYLSGAQVDQVSLIETYQRKLPIKAGVSVAQPAFAVRIGRPTGNPHFQRLRSVGPDQSVDPGAASLAGWLSQRPYLIASDVTRSTVDGRPAWTVDVRLRHPGPEGVALCNAYQPCMPMLSIGAGSEDRTIGMWDAMVSRLTFVDLQPGTAVIWSWSFQGKKPLADNQALIDTIAFDGD